MLNHIRSSLAGKTFEASIGEPWNFESHAGQNKLAGVILATSIEGSDVDWLLLKVSPFDHKGHKIKQVVGVNRYSSSQDVFGQLLAHKIVTLNFMFTLDGHELTESSILSELSNQSNFSFLVGSMKYIKK